MYQLLWQIQFVVLSLSEIPSISFDDMPNKHFNFMNKKYDKSTKIINNQSPLHNEFLAHRISLIPLNLNNHKIESRFSPEVNERIFSLNEQDSFPEFELRLQMEKTLQIIWSKLHQICLK